MNSDQLVHVVAAVIYNDAGEVLLSRRPDHVHLGGLWEFPGGKVETGETPEQALERELREELGIVLEGAKPLVKIPYTYPEKSVLLDVWQGTDYRGIPAGAEGQELVWVAPEQLSEWRMPPADRPIIAAIRLPDRYLITPEPGADWELFLTELERSLHRDVALVQFRAKALSEGAYRELGAEVVSCCHRRGARVLLNQVPEMVPMLSADGIHLSSDRLTGCDQRPLSKEYWVAASCHSLDELQRAVTIDADFAVLGPVRFTASHPESLPMGWDRFSQLVNGVALPVYALGGMRISDISTSRTNGGQGAAAISGLWATERQVSESS